MKIGAIQWPCFNPYNKPTIELYISGCKSNCKGCHNPQLQDFNYGEEININNIISYLGARRKLFDVISITGGDLLNQPRHEAVEFIFLLSNTFLDKEFWLFTGKELYQVPDWAWMYFDCIKVGPYKEELKQEGFPSSSNQRILVKRKDY